jgi:hypothetical protein
MGVHREDSFIAYDKEAVVASVTELINPFGNLGGFV